MELKENPRWRAKFGEEYWYISDTLDVKCDTEDDASIHDARYYGLNYFQTKDEAEDFCEIFYKILLSSIC